MEITEIKLSNGEVFEVIDGSCNECFFRHPTKKNCLILSNKLDDYYDFISFCQSKCICFKKKRTDTITIKCNYGGGNI